MILYVGLCGFAIIILFLIVQNVAVNFSHDHIHKDKLFLLMYVYGYYCPQVCIFFLHVAY